MPLSNRRILKMLCVVLSLLWINASSATETPAHLFSASILICPPANCTPASNL